ncbi:MAG: diacylglycerol kinase family protein [Flammeovirgaceae bacterium]|nr:diacylglycerol kinase family protein [Flammeovirgaceae bacterium]
MIKYLIKELKSFKHAFAGIKLLSQDHNFYFHFPVGMIVLILAFLFKLDVMEWLWVILAIGLVWITEAFNTAIEKLVDLVSPEYNVLAGKVKDISAASVFLAVIFSGSIGLIIFIPHFIELVQEI